MNYIGNRAIYCIVERNRAFYYYAHNGANALSPLLRLAQAQELQLSLPELHSIAHIFSHLDADGAYQKTRLADEDMFCEPLTMEEAGKYLKRYANHSDLEMQITLDLDHKNCHLAYNPNCPWYEAMGSYSIDLDSGLENVQKLLAHAEQRGITGFDRLLTIHHNSTGLADKLEDARGAMRVKEYMDSPEAEEQRRLYRELVDRQTEPDEKNDEMEER